jgi:hypothetical protein
MLGRLGRRTLAGPPVSLWPPGGAVATDKKPLLNRRSEHLSAREVRLPVDELAPDANWWPLAASRQLSLSLIRWQAAPCVVGRSR